MGRRPPRESALIRLLDSVYEAAFEPSRWADVLEGAMSIHGALGGRINFTDFAAQRDTTLAVRGIDPVFHARWMAERTEQDVWAVRGLERLLANPGRRTATGAEVVPRDELHQTAVHREVLAPHGIEDALMTAIQWSESSLGGFALWRGPSDDPFDRGDCELHDWLGRHVTRALRIGRLLRLERDRTRSILERLPCAALLCEADGRILQHNARAEALLRRGEGLRRRGDHLGAVRAGDRRALERALALAVRSAAGEALAGGTTLRIARGPVRAPLALAVEPLPHDGPAAESLLQPLPAPAALVLASDPESRPLLPADALRDAFGLTAAEARLLAALCAGETANEYAERQGLSRETGRYHVKRLLAKTGARRQADLVRLALASVARLLETRDERGG